MQAVGVFRAVALAVGVCLLAGSAIADIKSFNAAMQKRDYKAAAAAAASAWSGMDKSRKDLAIIAREFGFAAYLAGDYEAARTYGAAAVAASEAAGEETAFRVGSELTLRLAEYRLDPKQETRDRLFTALQARMADPTIDLLAFTSASVVATHDYDEGKWRTAMASAAVGEKLTANRGPGYDPSHFRFGLLGAAARYMVEQNMAAYDNIVALQRRIIGAIGDAPSNQDLRELEEVYYEADAWGATAYSHLSGMRRLRDEKKRNAEWDDYRLSPAYLMAMSRIMTRLPPGTCAVRITDKSPQPRYPSSALYKGMIGTIVVKMDVDAAGKASNARLMAAVPAKHFADAVLTTVPKLIFEPVPGSPDGCTLAQKDKVITYQFMF